MLLRKLSDGLRSGHMHSVHAISELTLSWLHPFQSPSWVGCLLLSAGEVASSFTGVGHGLEELVTYPWSPVSLTVQARRNPSAGTPEDSTLVLFLFPGSQHVK